MPDIICSASGLVRAVSYTNKVKLEYFQHKGNPAFDFAKRDDMKIGTSFVRMAAASAGLAIALGFLCLAPLRAQGKAPRFEVDPAWPKPLPNLWVTGGIGGVCIDSRDHVFILNRRDLTDNDLDAGHQAPVVIEFDPEGNVVNSFGDPDTTPNTPHGCAVDAENNVWMTGNGDGIVQKYSHDGSKLLFQIGKRGVVDSSDGTAKGKALNSSHEGFYQTRGHRHRFQERRCLRGRRRNSRRQPPHRGVRSQRAVPAPMGFAPHGGRDRRRVRARAALRGHGQQWLGLRVRPARPPHSGVR